MTQDNSLPPVPPSDQPNNAGPTGGTPLNYAPPSGGIYAGPTPDKDAKTMALLSHLLGILLGFLGPLLIWLLKKDSHPFVDDQGKEALNFQLTLMIGYAIAVVTSCIFIGMLIGPAVWILGLVFAIIGTMKANNGEAYRYPFNIRFIK